MDNSHSDFRTSSDGKNPSSPAHRIIEGELVDWFETGMEGTAWKIVDGVQEGYDGLHAIEEGDELTISDKSGEVLWTGTIQCDYKTGAIPRTTNPEFVQQHALGLWIHWIQAGFHPDRWAEFFIRSDDDRLRGVLIKKANPINLSARLRDTGTGRIDANPIADLLGISRADIARLCGVSMQSLNQTPSSSDIQAKLQPLEDVSQALLWCGGSETKLRAWLSRPNCDFPEVDGKKLSPRDLILRGHVELVVQKVHNLRTGQPS